MKLALEEEEENARNSDIYKDAVVGGEHRSRYLRDSLIQTEPALECPVPSTAEDAVNCRVDLLKVKLEIFAGNTSYYSIFVKHFGNSLESMLKTDGQLLPYLLQYCKVRARDVTEECIFRPACVT